MAMANRLELAIDTLRGMPPDKQEMLVDLMIDFAEVASEDVYAMSAEEARLFDEGIKDIDEGRGVPHSEVKKLLAQYRR
jgi:hypothetical protein